MMDDSYDYSTLLNIAVHYYYNSSIIPENIRKMTETVCTNVSKHSPTTTFETSIIAIISFFVSYQFQVVVAENELTQNVQVEVPDDWRNAIYIHHKNQMANYFIKLHDQTFIVCLVYNSTIEKTVLTLCHDKRDFILTLRKMEIDGLLIEQVKDRWAAHILTTLDKSLRSAVKNAVLNQPPSSEGSPSSQVDLLDS
ncbi:uncharacterized protein LOC135845717 [Planococcus citri]|uniref:uncharacterized protein LOC135845717 n=1 Tax=Planococcus citri TaxID=170843 RepID=UPI0031F973B2